jgi:hypothetical protein
MSSSKLSIRQRLARCEQKADEHDAELEQIVVSLDAPHYRKLLIRHVLSQVMSSDRRHSFKSPEKRARVILRKVQAQFDVMTFDKLLLNWTDTHECASARATRREEEATEKRVLAEKEIECKWASTEASMKELEIDSTAKSNGTNGDRFQQLITKLPPNCVKHNSSSEVFDSGTLDYSIETKQHSTPATLAPVASIPELGGFEETVATSAPVSVEVLNATHKRQQMERRLSRLFDFDDVFTDSAGNEAPVEDGANVDYAPQPEHPELASPAALSSFAYDI